jgi:hypothetical protein
VSLGRHRNRNDLVVLRSTLEELGDVIGDFHEGVAAETLSKS